MSAIDPITFAVIKSGLDTIVDDMAYAVMRTARSPIVRDVLDYSVTLCDRQGRILSQAKTVALHLGAVPDAMDVVMERFGDSLARWGAPGSGPAQPPLSDQRRDGRGHADEDASVETGIMSLENPIAGFAVQYFHAGDFSTAGG